MSVPTERSSNRPILQLRHSPVRAVAVRTAALLGIESRDGAILMKALKCWDRETAQRLFELSLRRNELHELAPVQKRADDLKTSGEAGRLAVHCLTEAAAVQRLKTFRSPVGEVP